MPKLSLRFPPFQNGAWNELQGREYFHSFSLTEGGNTENIRTKSKSNGFSKKRLKPNTEYSYVYTVHNEFDRVLFSASGTVTTGALPVPAIAVSVSGTSISVDVTVPAGIEKVRLESADHENYNDDGSLQKIKRIEEILRTTSSDLTQTETKTVTISSLNPSTNYHVHVASLFLGEISEWSSLENVITGSYLAPQNISAMRVNGLGNGSVRIRFRFGSDFRDEVAMITKYRQGELQTFPVTTIKRSGDPRDKDDREDRIDITVSGQEVGNFTYVATPSNPSGVGGSDTDSDNVT